MIGAGGEALQSGHAIASGRLTGSVQTLPSFAVQSNDHLALVSTVCASQIRKP
jgi:hypothetical protein